MVGYGQPLSNSPIPIPQTCQDLCAQKQPSRFSIASCSSGIHGQSLFRGLPCPPTHILVCTYIEMEETGLGIAKRPFLPFTTVVLLDITYLRSVGVLPGHPPHVHSASLLPHGHGCLALSLVPTSLTNWIQQ